MNDKNCWQDFSFVLSGGRDKRIYLTDLTTRHSLLVAMEEFPVLSVRNDLTLSL
jgi:hypothetical protein